MEQKLFPPVKVEPGSGGGRGGRNTTLKTECDLSAACEEEGGGRGALIEPAANCSSAILKFVSLKSPWSLSSGGKEKRRGNRRGEERRGEEQDK